MVVVRGRTRLASVILPLDVAEKRAAQLPAACDELTRAVDLVGQTGSGRSIATIRQARDAMHVYDGLDSVRRFDLRFREVVHDAA